jgi:hypothetical protein
MKVITGTILAAAVLALCVGTPAIAQQRPHHPAGAQGRQWQPGQNWDFFLAGFDTNKDGKVSKDEFMAKKPLFDKLDTNKDGFVTKEEVDALPAAQKHPGITGFIAKFDTDKDGKVSMAEWNAKRTAGFDKVDANHDGFIDKDEYTAGAKELAGAVNAGP